MSAFGFRSTLLAAALSALLVPCFVQAKDGDPSAGFGGFAGSNNVTAGQVRINADIADSNFADAAVRVIPFYQYDAINTSLLDLAGYWVVGQACKANPSGQCPYVEIVVSRLHADGSPDFSFGSLGTLKLDRANWTEVTCATVGETVAFAEDRLFIGGTRRFASNDTDFAIVWIDNTGNLVTSFGAQGEATIAFDGGSDNGQQDFLTNLIPAVVPTPGTDGAYPVLYAVGGAQRNDLQDVDFAIARYDILQNKLDPTFFTTGKRLVSFDIVSGGRDVATDMVVFDDNAMLIAGTAQRTAGVTAAVVAALLPDGSLDTSFCADTSQCGDSQLTLTAGKRAFAYDPANPAGKRTTGTSIVSSDAAGSQIWLGGGVGTDLGLFLFGRGSTQYGRWDFPFGTAAEINDMILQPPYIYFAGTATVASQNNGIVGRFDTSKSDPRDVSFATVGGQASFAVATTFNGLGNTAKPASFQSLALAPRQMPSVSVAPSHAPVVPLIAVGQALWNASSTTSPPRVDTDLVLMSFGPDDVLFRDGAE